jgi:hypothetical protein
MNPPKANRHISTVNREKDCGRALVQHFVDVRLGVQPISRATRQARDTNRKSASIASRSRMQWNIGSVGARPHVTLAPANRRFHESHQAVIAPGL